MLKWTQNKKTDKNYHRAGSTNGGIFYDIAYNIHNDDYMLTIHIPNLHDDFRLGLYLHEELVHSDSIDFLKGYAQAYNDLEIEG